MAAPINNNGGRKSDKLWRDALMIAAKRTKAETEELLADASAPLLAKAAARVMLAAADDKPDLAAAKEVGDRIDGKPKQQTEITGGEDADGNAIPASINVNFKRGD